jgi:hypothetical protein
MSEAKVGSVVEAKTPRETPDDGVGCKRTNVDRTDEAFHGALGRPEQSSAKPSHPSGFQRTTSAIRTLLPLVQKVLPLLDGNIALVAANLLAPRLQAPVDLRPVEAGLAKLHAELSELHNKNAEHDAAFKRIGAEIETVKEALERSALEQKELAHEVSRSRARMTFFSVVGVIVLIASLAVDVVLLLRIQQVLH